VTSVAVGRISCTVSRRCSLKIDWLNRSEVYLRAACDAACDGCSGPGPHNCELCHERHYIDDYGACKRMSTWSHLTWHCLIFWSFCLMILCGCHTPTSVLRRPDSTIWLFWHYGRLKHMVTVDVFLLKRIKIKWTLSDVKWSFSVLQSSFRKISDFAILKISAWMHSWPVCWRLSSLVIVCRHL